MLHRNWLGSLAIAAAMTGATTAAFAEDATVQVREATVREQSNYGGRPLGVLKYGDLVTILDKSGEGWRRVENKAPSKLAGWVRTSDLTSKELKTAAGASRATASAGEITDASKGLLEKGEGNYVSKNNLAAAMAQVDAIEQSTKVDPSEIQSFLTAGSLKPAGGN